MSKTTKKSPVTKKQTTAKKVSMRSVPSTWDDFKTAALVVSATINVGIFVGWLALQITTKYDQQVAQFLFG